MAEVQSLGPLLDQLRRQRRLTVAELATAAGVNYRTLVKYLRDERGMDLEVAVPLFKQVGWDAAQVARVAGLFATGEGFDPDEVRGRRTASPSPRVSRSLQSLVFAFETEARTMGATLDDMDYIDASLSDENILRLIGDASPDRPLSADEQQAELEIRLDELRAWLTRRIAIRKRKQRR